MVLNLSALWHILNSLTLDFYLSVISYMAGIGFAGYFISLGFRDYWKNRDFMGLITPVYYLLLAARQILATFLPKNFFTHFLIVDLFDGLFAITVIVMIKQMMHQKWVRKVFNNMQIDRSSKNKLAFFYLACATCILASVVMYKQSSGKIGGLAIITPTMSWGDLLIIVTLLSLFFVKRNFWRWILAYPRCCVIKQNNESKAITVFSMASEN